MGKVYYNQADSRWANHPYPSQELPNATIKSGGCGPTCAAMVISSSKEIITPDVMGDICRQEGFRQNGGTTWDLFAYVAQRWGLETREVKSSYEALDACKDGYFVVINVGEGLWTTGGHYILAVGARNDQIEIYDPYLYIGKFDRYGREGKVSVEGVSCFVQIDTFKQYSNARRFFAYKITDFQPEPSDEPKSKYVNTQSKNLNVRNAPGGSVIGSLPKGTQVLVYEEVNGWSRIGDNKWVSSQYLADNINTSKVMHVVNVSSHLNVRSGPSTNNSKIGSLSNNDRIVSDRSENGWYHIIEPIDGWVSGDYVSDSEPNGSISYNRGTVGTYRRFSKYTKFYSNPDLTGEVYTYLANTKVKILANISANVDYIYVVQTGRTGYIDINNY